MTTRMGSVAGAAPTLGPVPDEEEAPAVEEEAPGDELSLCFREEAMNASLSWWASSRDIADGAADVEEGGGEEAAGAAAGAAAAATGAAAMGAAAGAAKAGAGALKY